MTAVEWLKHQYNDGDELYTWDFEYANEMFEKQIKAAHLAGQNSAEEVDGQTDIQYYNETFRKN